MGKRLIVAEKPSVGRDIAHVLNCKNNKNGYIVGDNDIVTWAVGHLVRLLLPPEINPKFAVWNLDDLPSIPKPFLLGPIDNTKKQFELVKELMNDSEVIIGENLCENHMGSAQNRERTICMMFIVKSINNDKKLK